MGIFSVNAYHLCVYGSTGIHRTYTTLTSGRFRGQSQVNQMIQMNAELTQMWKISYAVWGTPN